MEKGKGYYLSHCDCEKTRDNTHHFLLELLLVFVCNFDGL